MTYKLETAISQAFPDRILVRGYNLVDLAGRAAFGDVVYLLLKGDLPARNEGRLIEAMLICMAEHAIHAPSTHAARTVANSGSPLQAAVAAGVLSIGDHHGGAGEACARLLQAAVAAGGRPFDPRATAARLVDEALAAGQRLPGFGHRLHDPDPRAVFLVAKAREWELAGPHTALAEATVDALRARTGKSLPLNVDGALAALASDMGFDAAMGKGLFILARTAGLLAHVQEEYQEGKPFKFVPRAEVSYRGPQERPVE